MPLPPTPRHRLLFELGRGGMGTVYLALRYEDDGAASRLVVVKRLHPASDDDPEARKMFVDEARICSRIDHPNVVRTQPAFEDERGFGLEMEYLEGQPFDAVLRWARSGGALPLPLAVHVVRGVLAGLHAAHELRDAGGAPLQVVHRDVSPHNVFVLYDGGVKVLDFGIAKAVDSSARTRTGMVKGKLGYMAPEQAARRPVDRRADVFAAGIVLWEAASGRRFWPPSLDELELLARLQSGELPSLEGAPSPVPPPLAAILARATAAQPEERYPTADDFERALAGFAREHGCEATDAELGAFVSTTFADRRRGTEARILASERAIEAGLALEPELAPPIRDDAQKTRREIPSASTEGVAATRTLAATDDRVRAAAPRRPGFRRTFVALLAAAGLVAATGAYALRARRTSSPGAPAGSASARACAADAECAAGGRDQICGAQRVCVDRPRCDSSAACTREHGGEAHVCRRSDGRCQRVASEDCEAHAEPRSLEDDRTIWLGTMFPLKGPDGAAFGVAHARAAELARQDFMRTAAGISTRDAKSPPRPLGLVSCDDAGDPERVARHLVDDLGVPAIVGFRSSKEVVDLATSVFIPKGVLAISALNGSPAITQLPHPPGSPRLVLRTAVSSTRVVEPWSPLIDALVSAPRAGAPAPRVRVALVRSGAAAGIGLSDVVVSRLRFNGKSVPENGSDFRELVYGDPTGKESAPGYEATARALVDFAPHVILYALLRDETNTLLEPVERGWRADVRHRPYHLVGGAWEGADFLRFLGRDAERRRRFLALRPPSATPTNLKFTLRYNETFAEPVSVSTAPGAPYDSIYLLAYAAFVAGEEPLTGVALARAVPRLLPPGEPAPVGAASIFTTFDALRAGRNVDLQGAWSRLDFDLGTGETPSDFVVTCPSVEPSGQAGDAVESGLWYDAGARRLMGELRCP